MSGPRPPPRPPQNQAQSPQAIYNPQLYAQPSPPQPQYVPYTYNSTNRPPPAAPPRPYNPAAYQANQIAQSPSQPNFPPIPSQGPTYGSFPAPPSHPGNSPASPASNAYSPALSHVQYNGSYQQDTSGYPSPSRAYQPPPPHPPSHAPSMSFPGPSFNNSYRAQTYSPQLPQPSPSPDFHHGHTAPSPSADDYTSPVSQRASPYPVPAQLPIVPITNNSQQTIPQRSNTSGRHPQSRPLPGFPAGNPASQFDDDSDDEYNQTQEALFNEVETMMSSVQRHSLRMPDPNRHAPQLDKQQPLSSYARNASRFPERGDSVRALSNNGHTSQPDPERMMTYYDDYGDDSDAEAAAGLEAMRMAQEEEEANQHRPVGGRRTNGLGVDTRHLQSTATTFDSPVDDDYHNVDMSMYGGGLDMPMTYGSDRALLSARPMNDRFEADPYVNANGMATVNDRLPVRSSNHAHAAYARVDEPGTGGFEELSPRRLSFDKDDDQQYIDEQTSSGAPAYYESNQPISHPLPSLPSQEQSQYLNANDSGQTQTYAVPANHVQAFPPDPSAYPTYGLVPPGIGPRSQSLGTHSTTQPLPAPTRAKTDAEERKRLAQRGSRAYPDSSDNAALGLDLPSIPAGSEFDPSLLTQADFDQCAEPWALSSVSAWLRQIAEQEQELKEQMMIDALVQLFNNKVPNMNILHAEALALLVFQDLISADVLVREEEWLRFGQGTTSGVIYQLTGMGCYAPSLHEHESPGRCYAGHCQRTIRKLFLKLGPEDAKQESWLTFYKLTDEDLKGVDSKVIKLQNVLFEVVQSEEKFVHDMDVFKTLYMEGLQTADPCPIPPKRLRHFIDTVFGKLEEIQKINGNFLLPQLRYRQQEQGPYVKGFSDIFRDWVRKAKHAFVDYISNMPNADITVRLEKESNPAFAKFLDTAQKHKLSQRLGFDHYFKTPSSKLQRYKLLLEGADKEMKEESEEKSNLKRAIEEVKELTLMCDDLFAENLQKAKVRMLQSQLVYRPETNVSLNLDQLGRELLFSGDLQRTGGSRFTWVDTHCILLDNYLVLTKPVKDPIPGSEIVRYDVSKIPIPMDLLILESADDDPVIKSTVKGITTVASAPVVPQLDANGRVTRTPTGMSSRPGAVPLASSSSLTTVTTNASDRTMITTTVLPGDTKDNKLFPFRLRHLGKEVYILYASEIEQRRQWCTKIIEAKTKHASSLHQQNAEPFKLRVVADAAFAYDTYSGGQKSIMINGTPLSRAIEDVENRFRNTGRPGPVCRARVNCATTFSHTDGKQIVAIGTDYGVYISEIGHPRGFTRAISVLKVSQIAVLEEFNLCLLISDKSLIAYHLDVIAPASGVTPPNDSVKKAPQKLSGQRDVGFFNVGRMKDRTLVFYKKRDGLSSTFRILEPIYQKAAEKKSRLHLPGFRGHTEFFREYDEFYIPTECNALDIFSNSLSVATNRGFEVLNLDKKLPWSVPDLKAPHVASIAARLHGTEPLAMFRLAADGSELLCVYEGCAVYVNKHGDINRGVVMEFVGRAKQASLVGNYLILFDADFVEVRDALNGRLKQIIAGRDVRCLDNGRGGASGSMTQAQSARTVKFALQHPQYERTQIIVELQNVDIA